MNNYDRWEEAIKKSHDTEKEAEIVKLLAEMTEEPEERITSECIGTRMYLRVSFSDEKSRTFCKFLVEQMNTKLGGVNKLNNTLIELAHRGQAVYRCEVKGGEIDVKYICWDEEE